MIMCIPESVLKMVLDRDLSTLISRYPGFAVNSKYIYLRISTLHRLFIEYFGLKYQQEDRILINKQDIVNSLKRLNICSPFKFNRANPKRCKIIKRKVKPCC